MNRQRPIPTGTCPFGLPRWRAAAPAGLAVAFGRRQVSDPARTYAAIRVPHSRSQSKSDQVRPFKFMNPTKKRKIARIVDAKPRFAHRSAGGVLAAGLHSAIRAPHSTNPT